MKNRTCLRNLVILFAAAVWAMMPLRAVPAQQERHFEGKITVIAKLDYLLYLPAGYDRARQKWPLVLFLHGAGESGTDLAKVKTHGPPKLVEAGREFPFILVSPQCATRGWNPDTLNALLDDLMRKYRVDKNRVYLTGLSMGGYGTWNLGLTCPEKFAAIVPICGGGELITILLSSGKKAAAFKSLGVWAFHGAKDPVVPLEESQRMVDFLKKAGVSDVKLTVYPKAGHDAWTETYNNPELYEWLLKHKRGNR